jgi:hypothetical protein
MKTISIVADDRVGLLADVSYILGKSKVNIESISVDVVGGKAVIVLTVKDAKVAKEILERNNYKVNEENTLVLKLPDVPGELSRITGLMAENHVDIKNVHIISRDGKSTVLVLMVDKPKKAETLLADVLVHGE